ADKTLETYRSELLLYHVFCNARNIPEHARCPASPDIISSFLATIVMNSPLFFALSYLIRSYHTNLSFDSHHHFSYLTCIIHDSLGHMPTPHYRTTSLTLSWAPLPNIVEGSTIGTY
ncbi:uncharacterized protein EV420DRAFT_1277480, partial [Desarmillaria tabescens]